MFKGAGVGARRLDGSELGGGVSPWRGFVDGYLSLRAGWVESGEVVRARIKEREASS